MSSGCDHCYAETIANRFAGTKAYPNGFDVTLWPDRLDQPLRWQRPRRVFVNSMSDLLHDHVPDEFIAQVFTVMALSPQHTFQVLTKRPGRMRSLLTSERFREMVEYSMEEPGDLMLWPLPNVWVGTSIEDQKWVGPRIDQLLATPAAVHFLSCEPLLNAVQLCRCDGASYAVQRHPFIVDDTCPLHGGTRIDWVIVGGESGPHARPMHPDWARSLRDQCQSAGVPFLFKQWGEWIEVNPSEGRPGGQWLMPDDPATWPYPWRPGSAGAEAGRYGTYRDVLLRRVGKRSAGRELDGRTWDEYPAVAQ